MTFFFALLLDRSGLTKLEGQPFGQTDRGRAGHLRFKFDIMENDAFAWSIK